MGLGPFRRTRLGADRAKTPKDLLTEYTHAIAEAAKIRMETAKEAFDALPEKDREAAHAKAEVIEIWTTRGELQVDPA